MPPKCKTPHTGGESQMSLVGTICDHIKGRLIHQQTAIALLCKSAEFSRKEASFLGHVAVTDTLTKRQQDWLNALLVRIGLLTLTNGGGQ